MEGFATSCRLCMWKGDKIFPIFTSASDDETASKIRTCLPLDVRWEDELPKGICGSCLYKVEMLYEFNISAVRVDSLLRKYLIAQGKDATINRQQQGRSGFRATHSVAVGTEDDYGLLGRTTRDSEQTGTGADLTVPRLRVRTPSDISDVNTGTAMPVTLPSQNSDPMTCGGHTSAVSCMPHRSDSSQRIDGVSTHGIRATEQSLSSSTIWGLPASGTTVQQEESGKSATGRPDTGVHSSSQGGAHGRRATAEDSEVQCLAVRPAPHDHSCQSSCECPSSMGSSSRVDDDDDEVVVVAEYQPLVRRSKTPTGFDGPPARRKSLSQSHGHVHTQRLCPRHQDYLRRINQAQANSHSQEQRQQHQGPPQQESLQGADGRPSRAGEQASAAAATSAGLVSSGASQSVQSGLTQQVAQDQPTQSDEQARLNARDKPPGSATGPTAALVGSDTPLATAGPGPSERAGCAEGTRTRAAAAEAEAAPPSSSAKCNSSQDRAKHVQWTQAQPQGTTTESSWVKPCGSILSPGSALSPAGTSSQSAVQPQSVPVVPLASGPSDLMPPQTVLPPASAPVKDAAPPKPAVPTPSATLTTTSLPIQTATLPTIPVQISTTALPGTPLATPSTATPTTCQTALTDAPPATSMLTPSLVCTPTASQPVTSTGSPSPVMSPFEPNAQSTARKQSATQSRSHSITKSSSSKRRSSSESPLPDPPTPSSTLAPPPAPPATPMPPPLTPPGAPCRQSLSVAPSLSLLPSSALTQLQQQENGQQNAVLQSSCGSMVVSAPSAVFHAHGTTRAEQQMISRKLQDGLIKFPAFLFVTNASFQNQTRPEQQGKLHQISQTDSPGTAATGLSALPPATAPPEMMKVPKEREQKLQSVEFTSPRNAISQLIAASTLISPPRGPAELEQREKKSGEERTKSSGASVSQLAVSRMSTSPPHLCAQNKLQEKESQTQREQQKNKQQAARNKLSAKAAGQGASLPSDADKKGGSPLDGRPPSTANRQLTNSTSATATSQSRKRKKEQHVYSHQSLKVEAKQLTTLADAASASPNSEELEQVKQKSRTIHSPTEKSVLKSASTARTSVKSSGIADKVKQTPQVVKREPSAVPDEQQQTVGPQEVPNSDIHQKFKKKKKKREKEEHRSQHRPASNKCQEEPSPQKRKQPSRNARQPGELLSPQPEAATSPQEMQKTEPMTRHSDSQPQPTNPKYDLSGGEVVRPQSEVGAEVRVEVGVERWRDVQQDAVECVRVALRECGRLPQPPTPPQPPSAVTPTPPVLTPQRSSVGWATPTVPVGSPSPPPPTLPPAVSAPPRAHGQHSGSPLLQCTTPPPSSTRFLTPTPPDGGDQQRSRSQTPSKAVAEGGERQLRTPSPANNTGSVDWPSALHRDGTTLRKYYNKKKRHLGHDTGEVSGAGGNDSENVGDGADRSPRVLPPPATPPPRGTPKTPTKQTLVVRPETHRRSVSSTTALRGSPIKTPLPPSKAGSAARFFCHYCQQRFEARILLSLHRVNRVCELHRSHNYARRGRDRSGHRDHPQVTEDELMKVARVRLERLHACLHCSRVFSNKMGLKRHMTTRHGRDCEKRATLQARWQPWTQAHTPPPLLLPPASRSCEDNLLEALGLTRRT